MPALPSVVSDYIDAVTDSLKQGSDLGSNVRGAAQNYLRAQDMATVLDLLQQALTQSSVLEAVGGDSFSVEDGSSTFVANSQVGNTVVFEGNTTSELADVERVVVSNDTTTLFFSEELPASPASGDEYTIRGTMFDAWIDDLREGKNIADAPAGNVYGDYRTVVNPIMLGIERLDASLVERRFANLDTVSDSTTTVLKMNTKGVPFRTDEFKGMKVSVDGESRFVVTNDENSITLNAALSSAPSSSTAVEVAIPVDNVGSTSAPKIRVHPGAEPGENIFLANLIDQLRDAVVAFTLPT